MARGVSTEMRAMADRGMTLAISSQDQSETPMEQALSSIACSLAYIVADDIADEDLAAHICYSCRPKKVCKTCNDKF